MGDSAQAIVWTLEAGGLKKRLGSQLIGLGGIGERTEQGGNHNECDRHPHAGGCVVQEI